MPVTRKQIMDELQLKLSNDGEVADEVADVSRQVEYAWKSPARDTLTAGYWTGEYAAAIHRVGERGQHAAGTMNAAGKKIGGPFMWHWKVVNDSDHAHFIEYGTDADDAPNWPDPPNEWGHWVDPQGMPHRSPWTPTPVFALAAQIEADFSNEKGGLPKVSKLPKSKGARKRVKNGTRASRSRLRMEAGG